MISNKLFLSKTANVKHFIALKTAILTISSQLTAARLANSKCLPSISSKIFSVFYKVIKKQHIEAYIFV